LVAVPSIGRASLVEPRRDAAEVAAAHGLYERHATRIQSYCLHQLGSREEAEDAVQTTFMNAFRALRKGVVPESEAAWLFKIAENVCLSRRRSSWRRNRIESPADFGVIEELVAGPNRQRDELIGIEDALASMPDQQRRAILLREWQGLSYREIAEELELSQSAVETLIFRARRSLAAGLNDPHGVKPQEQAKRKGFRRALHAFDLTTLLAAAKSLLAGSAAVKATTAAVAVTALAGGAATVAPEFLDPSPKPPLAVVDGPTAKKSTPAAQAAAPAVVAAAPAAFVERAAPVSISEPVKRSTPVAARRPSRSARATKPALPVQAARAARGRAKDTQPKVVGSLGAATKAERAAPAAAKPKAVTQTKSAVGARRTTPKVTNAALPKPTRSAAAAAPKAEAKTPAKSGTASKKQAKLAAAVVADGAEALAVPTADRQRGGNGKAADREK
jgi:RNA polymerase sigma factor (sigma-70 family)